VKLLRISAPSVPAPAIFGEMRDIGILKSIWTRRPDGRWGVHDMKGITLKPKPGQDADFFTFDARLELLTSAPPSNMGDLFASFGSTDFLMKQSIVPVVAWVAGAATIRCIGTAFVVSCTGYVVTASHVLLDPQESGYASGPVREGNTETVENMLMGVLMPVNPALGIKGFKFLPFQGAWYWGEWKESPLLHEEKRFKSLIDIAVCKLPEPDGGAAYQPLNLSLNPFSRGEEAYAIGYARIKDIPITYVDGQAHISEFDWKLYVSTGEVIDVFPLNHENKEVRTPGPCFAFQARIPGKMSGSPIFGAKGAVIRGVVSGSLSGEKHAYGCMMGPAMNLPLATGKSLKTLMRDGNDGIAVVQGQGL
jgi:hypothetical protein